MQQIRRQVRPRAGRSEHTVARDESSKHLDLTNVAELLRAIDGLLR